MKVCEYLKSVESALSVCNNKDAVLTGKDLRILARVLRKSIGIYRIDEAEEFLRFPDARDMLIGLGYNARQTAVLMRALAQNIPVMFSADTSMSPARLRRLAYEIKTHRRKYRTVGVINMTTGSHVVPREIKAEYYTFTIPYKRELMRRLN